MIKVLRRKIYTLFHTPRILMKKFAGSPLFRFLPDRIALQIQYRNIFLKKLNLENPETYSEKLQWLKLYNRRPEYTTMVDKYAVKEYVKEKIGKKYIIPTYGVWERFDDIDFDLLPDRFVLKCTHGSGDTVICRNKADFDKTAAKKRLTKSLKTDYYKISREWPYKNVPRRIIAERLLQVSNSPDSTGSVTDYKFYCFHGKPELLLVATERNHENHTAKFDFFDMQGNRCNLKKDAGMNSYADNLIPKSFEEMKTLARKLSEGIPHARVDFFEEYGRPLFGEVTLLPAAGYSHFEPELWDKKLGDLIHLPEEKYTGK